MSLEDRLAFVEGKRAELASIWEIETEPHRVDHSRVMRARFVLKWTQDSKGNPRAKASVGWQMSPRHSCRVTHRSGFSGPRFRKMLATAFRQAL